MIVYKLIDWKILLGLFKIDCLLKLSLVMKFLNEPIKIQPIKWLIYL